MVHTRRSAAVSSSRPTKASTATRTIATRSITATTSSLATIGINGAATVAPSVTGTGQMAVRIYHQSVLSRLAPPRHSYSLRSRSTPSLQAPPPPRPPARYTPISRNLGLLLQYSDAYEDCSCSDGRCGSECENRLGWVECRSSCPSGVNCCNKAITNGAKTTLSLVYISNDIGWGVRTDQPIKKGAFVAEYCGELITKAEQDRRDKRGGVSYAVEVDMNGSLFSLDARRKGSIARFLSHSCKPNCFAEQWSVDGAPRVALFAKRGIKKGEELTWSYGTNYFDKSLRCLCKACSRR